MALHDMGLIPFEEPFPSLFHQGLVQGADGHKMSKSRGNAVSPDPYVEEYGADIMRLFLMFTFNYADGGPWDDKNFKAVSKFVDRIWRLIEDNLASVKAAPSVSPEPVSGADKKLLYTFHHSLRSAATDADRFQFNTSIARFMELLNAIGDYQREAGEGLNKPLLGWVLKNFVLMLAPFAPHFAEEWWEMAGERRCIATQAYPKFDARWLELDEIAMAVMVNGKLRDEIRVPAGSDENKVYEIAMASDKVRRHVEAGNLVKKIFVPKKLINLIVK
jgi:leucyl-tRNA synthetase